MSLWKSVIDTAWLSSGAANAGNTGFSTLSTAQFETDENGDKFITTAAVNTGLNVRMDPTTDVFNGSNQYHVEFWIMAEFLGSADSNTVGTPSGFCLYLDDSGATGNVLRMALAEVNTTYTVGFAALFTVVGGTLGQTCSGVAQGPAGTFGGKECIPVNRMFAWGISGDRSNGVAAVTINGVRIGGWVASVPAGIAKDFTLQLPATPGVRWRIYARADRPCRSWIDADHEFKPDYANFPMQQEDGLQVAMPHISVDGGHGNFWSYTGNVTLSEFATGGGNPNRKRPVGGSGGYVATSKFDLGLPSYNEYGDYGIATTLYVPTGGTKSFAIRNAAGTVDLLKVQVSSSGVLQDGNGVPLLASDGSSVTLSNSHRYQLLLNLSSDGYAAWNLLTGSDDNPTRRAWSNQFARGWVPQAIGRIIDTGSQNTEADRFDFGPWITMALSDSLAVAFQTTVTPYQPHTANNLGYGYPHSDGVAIPGIEYHGRRWGQPLESWILPVGRSGRPHSYFVSGVRDYLTHARAIRFVRIDGGCWNDIATFSATAATLIAQTKSDIDWCFSHRCQYVTMPPFDRPMGQAPSGNAANTAIRRSYAAQLPNFLRSYAAHSDLIYYCDHPKAYRDVMRTNDGIHPSNDIALMTRASQVTRMKVRHWARLPDSNRYQAAWARRAS